MRNLAKRIAALEQRSGTAPNGLAPDHVGTPMPERLARIAARAAGHERVLTAGTEAQVIALLRTVDTEPAPTPITEFGRRLQLVIQRRKRAAIVKRLAIMRGIELSDVEVDRLVAETTATPGAGSIADRLLAQIAKHGNGKTTIH